MTRNGVDLETERVLIGALLVGSPPWKEVESCVAADDFAGEFHRRVFRAMSQVASEEPFDLVQVRKAMRVGSDEERSTAITIGRLVDGIPKSDRWEKYAAIVREAAMERRRQALAFDYAACGSPVERAELLASIGEIEQGIATGVTAGLPWMDLAVTPEPGRWLVRNIIPEQGRTLLVAPSNVGKSWILEDLALSVATGEAWLGLTEDFPVANNKGPVMIIDEESSEGRIHHRLARLCAGRGVSLPSLNERLLVSCLAGVNVGNPYTWGLLNAEVRNRKPCLVILDAAIRILDGDENASETISRFWRAVGGLQQHGTAVAIAHHTGWQEKGRSRGSSDFPGGADIELTVGKTDTADQVCLTWTKIKDRADSADIKPMLVDRRITPAEAQLVCAGHGSLSLAELTIEIYNTICGDGPISRAEIFALNLASTASVDRALKVLKDSNRVTAEKGIYRQTGANDTVLQTTENVEVIETCPTIKDSENDDFDGCM